MFILQWETAENWIQIAATSMLRNRQSCSSRMCWSRELICHLPLYCLHRMGITLHLTPPYQIPTKILCVRFLFLHQATGNTYRQWEKWVVNHNFLIITDYYEVSYHLFHAISTKMIRIFIYIGLTFVDSIILYHTIANMSQMTPSSKLK